MIASESAVGVVAIGRNEGERLRQCLLSLDPRRIPLIYVDSQSTDGSVALAESLGAQVVRLDMSTPFTAARARNEGFRRLLELRPYIEFVQFVDGDCEVMAGWLEAAQQFLAERPDVVAVAGRRNERFPDSTIYNTLCDLDWNVPPGEARAFGGDVLIRAAALTSVGGYDPRLIAGEEPELCIRLRRAGWKIWQLDRPMTLHDAAMIRFGQWWRRSVRTGYAFAEGAAMNGAAPERHWVRETLSAWVWGLGVPAIAFLLIPLLGWWVLAIFAMYPLQVLRLYGRFRPLGARRALVKSSFLVIGKFAQVCGALKYVSSRLLGSRVGIIEYKRTD